MGGWVGCMCVVRIFKVQLTLAVQHFIRPRAKMFLLLSGALPRIYTKHNTFLFTFEFHRGFHTGKLPM